MVQGFCQKKLALPLRSQVKKSSRIRSSHVNTGTSISREDLFYGGRDNRSFRHPKLRVSVEASSTTSFGGLSIAAGLSRSLKIPQKIDANLSLLQRSGPFKESDHVLTHVYNLFLGGTSIEDISFLQQSEPLRRILGTRRVPDPTTAGDFLRRFDSSSLNALDRAIDDMQAEVWRRSGIRKQSLGIVDIDSHVHHVYGNQKEGADFTHKGGFGFHPLVLTLSGTQEVLRVENRSGNVCSAEGAVERMSEVSELLNRRFRKVLWRGDSAFCSQDILDFCEEEGQYFAFVSKSNLLFEKLADARPKHAWKPFRAVDSQKKLHRRRKNNIRRQIARARGKRDLKLERQWLTEVPYNPSRSEDEYRLIIRRQRIEQSHQGELFTVWRYRYVLTNLPKSYSTEKVIRLTYQRCDQENIIEQLQNGVAGMRMPSGNFIANSAFLICARLAHNLKSWLAQLTLPAETARWEWKRFRLAFVYVPAKVTRKARAICVRLADSHRFAAVIHAAIAQLQV